MKQFLVPTDFSLTSKKALQFCLKLAAKNQGCVTLLHIYTPLQNPLIDTEEQRADYNKDREKKLKQRLDRLKKKSEDEYPGLEIKTALDCTPLIPHILEYATNFQIDLIVMGTQGASGLRKVFIGSEAARIVEKTTVPVLLVPQKYKWIEPQQIAFASNYQQSEKKALLFTLKIAESYQAMLTIFHLEDQETTQDTRVDFDPYEYAVQQHHNSTRIRFMELKTENLIHTFENLDKSITFDLIAMVKRKRDFLERFFDRSFTKSMAYITKYPLLVLPQDENAG